MKRWFTLFAAAALAQAASLPGAEALWQRPDLRFVLAGELHGSVETPAVFLDLVRSAVATGRQAVVGLERDTNEQKAIESFLSRDEHASARAALLSQPGWNMFDGRSSEAMLALLEDLRGLTLAEVVAFDDRHPGDSNAQREVRMADVLKAAAGRHPSAIILALTGNLHAPKRAIERFGGGMSWTQTSNECGPHKHGSTHGTERGVVLPAAAAPMAGFDGVLSTGLDSTASPPALEFAPPPPACSASQLK